MNPDPAPVPPVVAPPRFAVVSPWWHAAWLFGVVLLAHGWTIVRGGFVFDDTMVLVSPLVVAPDGPWSFFGADYFAVGTGEASWRPVASLSHWLDVVLTGTATAGAAAWHHAVNVALHAGAVLVLWRLARAWGLSVMAAVVGATLFAVHPLTTEAIGVVTFREEQLVALLAGGAALAVAARAAGPRRWVLAGVLALLACGAKESAVMLPVVLAGAAWALPPAEGQSRRVRLVHWVAPAAVGVACYLPLRFWWLVPPPGSMGYVGHPGGNPVTAVLTMTWICVRYCALLLWPAALSADHAVSAVRVWDGRALLGLGLAGGWLAGGVWCWRRSRPAFVAWLWTGAFLVPVLDLVPLANIMAERYCYVPLVGLAWLAGLGAEAAWRWAHARGAGARRAVVAGLALVVVACTARSAWRAPEFGSDASLWSAAAVASPGSYRATYMLVYLLKKAPLTGRDVGTALDRISAVEQARGTPLVPGAEYAERRAALRAALDRHRDGNPDDAAELTTARDAFAAAVTVYTAAQAPPWSPEEAVMQSFAGIAEREWGQNLLEHAAPMEARIAMLAYEMRQREQQGLDTDPVHAEISRLASKVQGMRPEGERHLAAAEEWLHRALRGGRMTAPSAALAWENLAGIAGLRDPGSDDVRTYCERALALEPRRPFSLYNLGLYWQTQSDRAVARGEDFKPFADRALAYFEQACEYPTAVRPAFLRWLEFRRKASPLLPGSPEEAAVFARWESLCDRFPDEQQLRQLLCRELVQAHRHDAAVRNLRRALAQDPHWAEGWVLQSNVVGESRPDGTPGDARRALAVLQQGLAVCGDALRRGVDAEGMLRSLRARIRQEELWVQRVERPDDYDLFVAIGLNAIDIPDYAVAQEHLARARAIDPTRFAQDGHEPRLASLTERLERQQADTQLREHGRAASLVFRARQAMATADLQNAWGWLATAKERDAAGLAAIADASSLEKRLRAALDLAEYGAPADLLVNARRASIDQRWPEAVFLWRLLRARDGTAFAQAEGVAALAAAEEALARR